ncbi:excisionase [Tardibacter chloracetimidivorans]|uniref:excisionase n=1 Tax=Tardibacter chloracetimidivorans TaxID=1921510 RepID=UPI001D036808|nr:excisionase [Tardibacter chloracetimidivorans]
MKKFADLTGYTEKAVYRKIEDGVWLDGREYRRAPDGNICIDLEGYQKWVEGGREPALSR